MFKLFKRNKQTDETRAMSVAGNFFSFLNSDSPSNYLSIGTVYACIRMISDSVSMTPVKVYSKGKDGRDEMEDSPLHKLLANPQLNTTNFQWMNVMLGQLVGWGNGYSVIEFDGITPKGLIFIPSRNVSIYETYQPEEPYYYRVTLINGKQLKVFPDQMIHFRNITLDGYTGLSPIGLHNSTFDRGFYEGEFATNFMRNGGSMSGIITTEKRLKKEQIDQLKKDFSTAYGGSSNAGKTPVLGDGMKYEQLKPISPADADYVRSKELTKAEIMEIFKVPPPLLGVIDATYNNTEQLALIYQRYTLSPIYTMIEQEMSLKLIPESQRGKTFMQFEIDALLNATAKDKSDVITNLTQKGVITVNEARKKYNLKDIDGMDDIILPLNSAPTDLHREVLTPKEEVVPASAAPEPMKTDDAPGKDDDKLEELQRSFHRLSSELGRLKKDIGNQKP